MFSCAAVNRHENTLLLPATAMAHTHWLLTGKYAFVTRKETLKRTKRRLLHITELILFFFFFTLGIHVFTRRKEEDRIGILACVRCALRTKLAWCQCLHENYMHESKCEARMHAHEKRIKCQNQYCHKKDNFNNFVCSNVVNCCSHSVIRPFNEDPSILKCGFVYSLSIFFRKKNQFAIERSSFDIYDPWRNDENMCICV